MRQVCGVVVALSVLLGGAAGAAARCGEQPGDAAAVAAAESVLTAQCRCCGPAAPYRRCVASVVRQAVRARSLPSTCKSKVKRDALVACPLALAATPCTDCSSDAQCDDGNPCTVDRCVDGTCEHGCLCVDARERPRLLRSGAALRDHHDHDHQHDDHAAPAALPHRCGLQRRQPLHGGPLRQRDLRARVRVPRRDGGGELLPRPGCPLRQTLWHGCQRSLWRRVSGSERGLHGERHHLRLYADPPVVRRHLPGVQRELSRGEFVHEPDRGARVPVRAPDLPAGHRHVLLHLWRSRVRRAPAASWRAAMYHRAGGRCVRVSRRGV